MTLALAPGPQSRAAVTDAPQVAGFVEAITADQVLGWAWDSGSPETRLAIELRLDGAVVAEGRADRPRSDLARHGIGDGAHAFAIDLSEAARAHAASVIVVARGVDGAETVLPCSQPAAPAAPVETVRLMRMVEALGSSQRLVQRNLQELVLSERSRGERADQTAEAVERLAGIQTRLAEQQATLEVFVVRLDERLAALCAEAPPPGIRLGRRDRVVLAIALALLTAGGLGLGLVWPA